VGLCPEVGSRAGARMGFGCGLGASPRPQSCYSRVRRSAPSARSRAVWGALEAHPQQGEGTCRDAIRLGGWDHERTFENIIVEGKGAVGVITLNRPKMLNVRCRCWGVSARFAGRLAVDGSRSRRQDRRIVRTAGIALLTAPSACRIWAPGHTFILEDAARRPHRRWFVVAGGSH